MRELFLHDPVGAPQPLARIIGGAAAAPSQPATLSGHALRTDAWGLRVALAAEPGAQATGRRIAVSDDALARLDFVMAAMGAARQVVAGATEAYLFSAAAPPDAAAAERPDWPAFLLEGLDEIAGHFGRRAADEMPALLSGIGYRAFARVRGARGGAAPVTLGTAFAPGDVVSEQRRFTYARFFGVEDHRLRHRRFDGTMSGTIDRTVFTSGDAVTVLPFDPRRDAVLLIEQFRAAPHARRDPRPWFLEAVAGRCDPLEDAATTARREAREEAGLELGRLERIAAYYASPGIMAEHITAFVGEAELGTAGGTHGLAEEHEDIRALVVPVDAALAAVTSGEIANAPLLVSLLWLAQHRTRLADAWREPFTS